MSVTKDGSTGSALFSISSRSSTASELVTLTGLELKPNTLTLRLYVNADRLMNEYHIAYENTRTHAGRLVKLALKA